MGRPALAEDDRTVAEAFKRADAALYTAKRAGRDRVVLDSENGEPDAEAKADLPDSAPIYQIHFWNLHKQNARHFWQR